MLMGPQKENQELAAGIGGVLRNDRDDIVTEFAALIGVRDSNEAEFLAIVFLSSHWIRTGCLKLLWLGLIRIPKVCGACILPITNCMIFSFH
ncbi:hypothetical protein P8452_47549 [Trifolium repens]|nr:hypothetical protein P8452_47549 [Trifolium repens]